MPPTVEISFDPLESLDCPILYMIWTEGKGNNEFELELIVILYIWNEIILIFLVN